MKILLSLMLLLFAVPLFLNVFLLSVVSHRRLIHLSIATGVMAALLLAEGHTMWAVIVAAPALVGWWMRRVVKKKFGAAFPPPPHGARRMRRPADGPAPKTPAIEAEFRRVP